jgi:predicted DNA-binding protein YlxM (UPF0122 family)
MYEQLMLSTFTKVDFQKMIDESLEAVISKISQNNDILIKYENISEKKETMNVQEVMDMLNIKRTAVWLRMKDGSLKFHRIGRKLVFFRQEIINSLIN